MQITNWHSYCFGGSTNNLRMMTPFMYWKAASQKLWFCKSRMESVRSQKPPTSFSKTPPMGTVGSFKADFDFLDNRRCTLHASSWKDQISLRFCLVAAFFTHSRSCQRCDSRHLFCTTHLYDLIQSMVNIRTNQPFWSQLVSRGPDTGRSSSNSCKWEILQSTRKEKSQN